jgi:hypothetical protein
VTGRFDAPEYVDAWQASGVFPTIHDRIVNVARSEIGPCDGTVLDLCSSTGLIGRRLADVGYQVMACQEPGPALQLGRERGVYAGIPVLEVRITPGTLGRLLAWCEDHQVRTVVARRCFPELWDALGADDFPVLVRELAEAGVERIVLEGRVASGRSVHPLATAAAEVAAFASHWVAAGTFGQVAVLTHRSHHRDSKHSSLHTT